MSFGTIGNLYSGWAGYLRGRFNDNDHDVGESKLEGDVLANARLTFFGPIGGALKLGVIRRVVFPVQISASIRLIWKRRNIARPNTVRRNESEKGQGVWAMRSQWLKN